MDGDRKNDVRLVPSGEHGSAVAESTGVERTIELECIVVSSCRLYFFFLLLLLFHELSGLVVLHAKRPFCLLSIWSIDMCRGGFSRIRIRIHIHIST